MPDDMRRRGASPRHAPLSFRHTGHDDHASFGNMARASYADNHHRDDSGSASIRRQSRPNPHPHGHVHQQQEQLSQQHQHPQQPRHQQQQPCTPRTPRASPSPTSSGAGSASSTFRGSDYFKCPELDQRMKKYLVRLANETANHLIRDTLEPEHANLVWKQMTSIKGIEILRGTEKIADNSSTTSSPQRTPRTRGTAPPTTVTTTATNATTTPSGTRETTCLRGVAQVNASIEEFALLFKLDTNKQLAEHGLLFNPDLLDMATLYSLVQPSGDQPRRYVGIKWCLMQSPTRLFRNRDFCYLECQKEFRDAHGRRGWVRSMHSIKMPCCPTLEKSHSIVRASLYRCGLIAVETDKPGVLDTTYTIEMDLKGHFPELFQPTFLSQRIAALASIDKYLQQQRLSSSPLLGDLDLPAASTATKVKGSCHYCFREFATFTSRRHVCRKCGEGVCKNCSDDWQLDIPVIGRKKVRICTVCSAEARYCHSTPLAVRDTHRGADRGFASEEGAYRQQYQQHQHQQYQPQRQQQRQQQRPHHGARQMRRSYSSGSIPPPGPSLCTVSDDSSRRTYEQSPSEYFAALLRQQQESPLFHAQGPPAPPHHHHPRQSSYSEYAPRTPNQRRDSSDVLYRESDFATNFDHLHYHGDIRGTADLTDLWTQKDAAPFQQEQQQYRQRHQRGRGDQNETPRRTAHAAEVREGRGTVSHDVVDRPSHRSRAPTLVRDRSMMYPPSDDTHYGHNAHFGHQFSRGGHFPPSSRYHVVDNRLERANSFDAARKLEEQQQHYYGQEPQQQYQDRQRYTAYYGNSRRSPQPLADGFLPRHRGRQQQPTTPSPSHHRFQSIESPSPSSHFASLQRQHTYPQQPDPLVSRKPLIRQSPLPSPSPPLAPAPAPQNIALAFLANLQRPQPAPTNQISTQKPFAPTPLFQFGAAAPSSRRVDNYQPEPPRSPDLQSGGDPVEYIESESGEWIASDRWEKGVLNQSFMDLQLDDGNGNGGQDLDLDGGQLALESQSCESCGATQYVHNGVIEASTCDCVVDDDELMKPSTLGGQPTRDESRSSFYGGGLYDGEYVLGQRKSLSQPNLSRVGMNSHQGQGYAPRGSSTMDDSGDIDAVIPQLVERLSQHSFH